MSGDPNKLSQFWQELKRRKVTRTITVYAAAAFVILELLSIIIEPLRLPDWTLQFAIVFLCIGFIIAVILSWIYDVHPEGGIVKTELAHKVKSEEIPKSSNSWKIASYISFVVIVGLIVLNIIPRSNNKEILEKSIAVLPFRNDSPDQRDEHIINGTMESILNNLCKIKDLRVVSRSSVEQYRGTHVYIPEVAEKLGISYVLEGSMQKYGDQIRLTIQLINHDDKHLWSEQYDREIKQVEEYYSLYSEIALLVAAEIEAIITPEEIQLIEKVPTASLTAYDFYQRGKDEYFKTRLANDNSDALETAEDLYYKALVYDSTFAQAYTGLAEVYWEKHYWDTYLSEDFLDSVLILADIALSFNDKLAEAYTVKGNYYSEKGSEEQAMKEFDKALNYNPNDWMAYRGKGWMYTHNDLVKTIDNFQKAASLNHGPEFPDLLRNISQAYHFAGFVEKGNNYIEEALNLDGDSVRYYFRLAKCKYYLGNYEEALELVKKAYIIDSTNIDILSLLGYSYMYLGQYEKSLTYFEKYIERSKVLGEFSTYTIHRIGYVYWQIGYKDEAEYYFNEFIEYYEKINELGRLEARSLMSYYNLAGVYAFKGEKDKAYEILRIYYQRQLIHLWMVTSIKDDPLFDSIRDESEFQQIVKEVEDRYQAEHERVRKWLEENDML